MKRFLIIKSELFIGLIFIFCLEVKGQVGKDNHSASQHDSVLSNQYLQSGLVKYKAKDYNGALSDFEMAIKNNPANWRAYRSKGDAEQELDRYPEAIESYTQALAVNKKDTLSYKGRAESKRMSGSYKESLEDYDIALEWTPSDADMYFGRGSAYYKLGNYSKSISDLNTSIKIHPKYVLFYFKRALSYVSNSQYREAKLDLNKYLQLGGKDEGVYYYLGLCEVYLSDTDLSRADSAINYLTRYTTSKNKVEYDNPWGYQLLGLAYAMKKDSARSRQNFRKSMLLNPENKDTYYRWGLSETDFKNYKKADELFTAAYKRMKSPSAEFYYRYGLSKASIRDTTMAMEYYAKALALDSNKREVYENRLALLYGGNARYLKTILGDLDDLIRLAKEDQEKAEWHSAKSFANLMAKDTASARMEIDKAIVLMNMEPMHYMIRAQINSAENKSIDIVLKDVDKAIRIDPTMTEAYLFKATYYALHGDHRNGCETLKYALKIGGSVPKEVENYICKGKLLKDGKTPNLYIPFTPRLTINKMSIEEQ